MDYNFAADLLSTFRSVHDGVKALIVVGFFGWLTATSLALVWRLRRAAPQPPRVPPPPRPALPLLTDARLPAPARDPVRRG